MKGSAGIPPLRQAAIPLQASGESVVDNEARLEKCVQPDNLVETETNLLWAMPSASTSLRCIDRKAPKKPTILIFKRILNLNFNEFYMKEIFLIRTMSKIVIGTFAIFCMLSCKYNCPAFRDENLCWIPYNKGDLLQYSDGDNVISFEVVDFYKTKPSSERGIWMDVWCEEEGYYLTNQESNYFIHEFYSLCCRHDKNEMEVKITDKDIFSFTVSPLSFYNVKQTIKTDLMEITFYPDTTIGNHQCTKTFFISKTKMNDSERISWIIKAKDKGIVQFFDTKSEKIWTLL